MRCGESRPHWFSRKWREGAATSREPRGSLAAQQCRSSAGMHRLRTTCARLRPLTAAHAAKTWPGPRLCAIQRDLRTLQPARHSHSSVTAEPFLNGTSSNYLEEMYYAWLEDPKNVHKVPYAKTTNKLYGEQQLLFRSTQHFCV